MFLTNGIFLKLTNISIFEGYIFQSHTMIVFVFSHRIDCHGIESSPWPLFFQISRTCSLNYAIRC